MKTKETFLTIDPPSGWKYGFPKAVTQEQYKLITDLKQWCIDNGYPKEEAHSYGDYFHIQINGDLSFINEDKSTREQALAWWNNLSLQTQQEITKRTRLAIDSPLIGIGLTGREIEEIWKKEVQELSPMEQMLENEGYVPKGTFKNFNSKPNQKQFKQFDESLFKAYIDKMPESESLSMIKIIYENKLPDCKFKSHLDKWFKL